ncbi:hypothetical protein AGMMS50268_36000 [Spirochaetia bacterium]|nr:hypothetical protein AGMMS50268_36000 [Spirochaetia bacterium]
MDKPETTGNCFLCGEELTKIKMKNHVLKSHLSGQKGEKVLFIKVEGAYQKEFWLLLDIALNATLEDLDEFLRQIWLECCGHMSGFYPTTDNFGMDEFDMDTKIKTFAAGKKLLYRYDFGSTTTLLVTMLDNCIRPPQKDAVRLLARNVPPEIRCVKCGKPAECFCPVCDCEHGRETAYYCEECYELHDCPDKEYTLPITNSPRTCVCGYDGELDVWKFDPVKIKSCCDSE